MLCMSLSLSLCWVVVGLFWFLIVRELASFVGGLQNAVEPSLLDLDFLLPALGISWGLTLK